MSSTLEHLDWDNSTVLTGDVVDAVSRLKQEIEGNIVVYASGQLVRTLLENDLVDELRLMTHPVTVGAGERLFDGTRDRKSMRLVESRTIGDGLVLLTYQLVRDA